MTVVGGFFATWPQFGDGNQAEPTEAVATQIKIHTVILGSPASLPPVFLRLIIIIYI